MTLADKAAAGAPVAVNARKPRISHPKGWEPGVVYEPSGGQRHTVAAGEPPPEDGLHVYCLSLIGLDSDEWAISGEVQVSYDPAAWHRRGQGEDATTEPVTRYKFRVVPRPVAETGVDLDGLLSAVAKRKPRPVPTTTGTAGLVVAWADWQVGKGDGDGVQGTMQRLEDMIGQVEDRWRDLKKIGVPLTTLYACGLGDLRESCAGHYPQQAFRTELNNRDQRKVIRWAIDSALDRWARFVPEIAVKAVGGNHGEEREGGKSFTDFADNVDVAVFEDVAYAYAKNPDRYGHVSFSLPNEDLTLTFQHGETVVGLAHGHQAGLTGGDPRKKIDTWWRNQGHGRQAVGDADILVTGHFHHPWMVRSGVRTHFGCPALDGGSDWFRDQSGMDAPPGTLTFVLNGTGWDHFSILDGRKVDGRAAA